MTSIDDRIELANAFVYTAGQQAEIVALMQPLHSSAEMFRVVCKPRLDERRNDVETIPSTPEEACIDSVTTKVRRRLVAFLEPRGTAKAEKERFERYIAALELAAQELDAACAVPADGEIRCDTYGPGPLLFLDDWRVRFRARDPSLPKHPFAEPGRLAAGLRHHAGVARRVLDGIDEDYAADFIARAHSPNRWRLAFDLLDWQWIETHNLPGRSRTSDAARLLLAALDPAMIYASRKLEIREACPLLTRENAENIIRRWEPPFTGQDE
jgi:hypothetical protein